MRLAWPVRWVLSELHRATFPPVVSAPIPPAAKQSGIGAFSCPGGLHRFRNALKLRVSKLARFAGGALFSLALGRIENPRVGGSNPPPGTIFFSQIAENKGIFDIYSVSCPPKYPPFSRRYRPIRRQCEA
jgi:hypothetical protein